jgi:hypothetical protein
MMRYNAVDQVDRVLGKIFETPEVEIPIWRATSAIGDTPLFMTIAQTRLSSGRNPQANDT